MNAVTDDMLDRFCLLWTSAGRAWREYHTHAQQKDADTFSACPSPAFQAECEAQMKVCAENATRWRTEARAILGPPIPVDGDRCRGRSMAECFGEGAV